MYDFIIFKKWIINLILKVVKSHFDDYFWLFIFVMLKLLIDHMNHMWSMKFCHHIQACSCHKVSSHHFWSCDTTFLSDKREVKKHIKISLYQHHIQFFLKNIICLSLQLSLLFSFLKRFYHLQSCFCLLYIILIVFCQSNSHHLLL